MGDNRHDAREQLGGANVSQIDATDAPLEVTALDGEVAITGPAGVAISLTRSAAVASARRILHAAGAEDAEEIYQKPLG